MERGKRKHCSVTTREEQKELVGQMCLMDDEFMTVCFENQKPAVQLVLRIILGKPDLVVQDVKVQKYVENTEGRSLRLDIHAVSEGAVYNCEIQGDSSGASARRARYHGSLLDTVNLRKGSRFRELPETYVIFITRRDKYRKGLPMYCFDRYCREIDTSLEDGLHIIYVNGQYRGDDDIGHLMDDFKCTSAGKLHYTELAERVRYFKETIEGEEKMSEIFRRVEKKAREVGREEGADRLGRLMSKLFEQNRVDDAKRASSDSSYRESLYKEFGIA